MPTIHFVRHGESEANVECSINDDPKRLVGLTSKGRSQCLTCADKLRSVRFTHAFASEFLRTQESLEVLLRHHVDVHAQIDSRLNEWHIGMDGMSVEFFHEQIGSGVRPLEAYVDVVHRIKLFIEDVKRLPADSHVLAVSHKIPIVAALVAASKLPIEEARHKDIQNCEIIQITV